MKNKKNRRIVSMIGIGAILCGSLTAGSIAGRDASASGASPLTPAASALVAGSSVGGSGSVSGSLARVVNLSSLPSASAAAVSSGSVQDKAPLGINGSRDSSAAVTHGTKPGAGFVPLVSSPAKVLQNFAGTSLGQSSCSCAPPDSNAAMNGAQILEGTNLALTVWKVGAGTTPTLIKRTAIATFLNTTDSLSDPRVFYDNAWKRFVMTVIVVPTVATATPAEWIAVSTSNSASGAWYIYRASFSGGPYAPGTLMDYPMVGMDADSIAISTNLYAFGGGFTTGSLFTVPKQRIYNGLGWGTGAFNVDFSSHPAFVEGIPQNQDGKLYVVASLLPYSQTGFDVYYLTNTDRPDSIALTYQGNAADSHGTSAPPAATQPGGGSLDALGGQLQAAPHQLEGNVWFARTENLAGFPTVEYGAIAESNLAVTSANAYVSGTSDDWNPSIAVSDVGGSRYVFLNWAYTDPTHNVNTSTRVAGLGPADGIQNLIGVGKTLATGGHTTETRFGDFSSVQIDPFVSGTCPAGQSALVANEQFNSSGGWQMRDARVAFC